MLRVKNYCRLPIMVTGTTNIKNMKKKTIAFLYNVRHHYPDPKDYRNQLEADFDDPETTKTQIKHLINCGYEVIPIEADDKAYSKLSKLKGKIYLVFNVAEGIWGKDREAQLPAILEMLQIPYTGCGPLTEGLVLNKAKTKDILIAKNIPTLAYQLFASGNEPINKKLKFPLIIKPVAQGSSAGITNQSVVYNELTLRHQVKKTIKNFSQQAIVESFITGREFSVAMIGNPPMVLPIIESDHSLLPKKYLPFDSLEVKWIFEEENDNNYLICPAKISRSLKKEITKMCLNTWTALDILDWCRIDIRCDDKERPYILEVNSPPGILPPEVSTTSYFPLASRNADMDYEQMLKLIINTALERYH